MKRLFFIALPVLLLSLTFSACNREITDITDGDLIKEILLSESATSIEPADLPTEVKNYVDDYFFDTYVEEAFQVVDKGFELRFGDDDVAFFNRNGRPLMFDGPLGTFGPHGPHGPCHRRGHRWGDLIAVEDLPVAITDYIAENYPDNEIKRAKLRNDNYFVAVDVPVILKFDSDGNFIEELSPLHNCHRPCNRILAEDLSDPIAAYIAENYPAAEFKRACERGDKTVVFLLGEEGRIILGFNTETGELLFSRP